MSENSGKELVSSGTRPGTKKIITGILFTFNYWKFYLLGVVEPISMDDADFQSLRLGFGRSGKRAKTDELLKKSKDDDPADVNGYVGPWGSKSTEISKITSGPTEVKF